MSKSARTSIACLLALAVISAIASGCAQPASQGQKAQVTDHLGRAVSIPKEVKRIASPYSIANSLVLALGAGDRIVGVEMNADKNGLYKKVAPKLCGLPSIGSGRSINIEETLKLNPDLVVLPKRMKDQVEQLEKQNVAVLAMDPENLESLSSAFLMTGKAIGREKQAAALADFYKQKLDAIGKLTKGVQKRPRVYLAGKTPLTTCTREMYQHFLIDLAGGTSASRELEKGFWAEVSQEQVVAWNPEVVFIVQYAPYKEQDIKSDPKWQAVGAVKSGRVYVFPSAIEPWDYPTPACVLGLLWATTTLHPDLYSRTDFEKDVSAFYKTFYGVELTPADLGL